MRLTFEWDLTKSQANLEKHGVSFDEARTVFRDPLSITSTDRSPGIEDRFVDIGYSAMQHLLVVVYTERHQNIRLISSRKATRAERRIYEGRRA